MPSHPKKLPHTPFPMYMIAPTSRPLGSRPWASLVAQTVKRLSTMRETWVPSLDQEDLLEKEMAIHSSTIAWKSHGQKSLVGYSPWGRKESDTTERLHFPFKILRLKTLGFPGSTKKQTNKQTNKKNLPVNAGDIKRHRFNPRVRKIPWRRAW